MQNNKKQEELTEEKRDKRNPEKYFYPLVQSTTGELLKSQFTGTQYRRMEDGSLRRVTIKG